MKLKLSGFLREINDVELATFAMDTLGLYDDWFGGTADPDWTHSIVQATYDGIMRDRILREYVIVIRAEYEYAEQRFAAVAHEMYHRVTMRRIGLHRHPWIDEMLAFLASQHCLCIIGLEAYAEQRLYHTLTSEPPMPVDCLGTTKRRRLLSGVFGPRYPIGFGSGVAKIGIELEAIVGWESICRIVQCKSWQDWLSGIPQNRHQFLSDLLGLAH